MTVHSIDGRLTLKSGVQMPQMGLGVLDAKDGDEARNAVLAALEVGYRSMDTAAVYGNEQSVGEAVRASGVPREEIFLTTKVWNTDHGYEPALKAFDNSLKKLGLDYVDMYLIHFAVPGKYVETWRAMEKLQRDGYVRTLGVSNFHEHHLQELLAHAEITPDVNQVELHPYFNQKALRQFNAAHGIITEAWSPLARGLPFQEPIITTLAEKYGKTPAQIVLRWELQLGLIIIPKSVRKERMIENAQVFDFELTQEEITAMESLGRENRLSPIDPDHIPAQYL